MTDAENEEIIEGPRVSSAFEFGGTSEQPRTRGHLWFRAMASESPPDRGLVLHVSRRPRTRKGQEPHPTVRVMSPNPAGLLYAKIKSGDVMVETEEEFQRRTRMMIEAGEDVGYVEGISPKPDQNGK